MKATIRCGACSTCLTLLVSLDPAGVGFCSRRVKAAGAVFVYWKKMRIFLRIDTYQPRFVYTMNKLG